MTTAPLSVTADRKRWLLVGVLFLAGLVNYMDRAALSVAAPLISRDLALTPSQLGLVFSSFSFGYALFCLVGGWSADRFGPKRVLLVSMTVWSVFCGLTAAATTLSALLIFRVVFGMGEGPFGATITKFVSEWFPPREQATAIAFANVGTPLGGALAGPIVGAVAVAAGWRAAFVAISVLSLLWVLLWGLVSADRTKSPRSGPVAPDRPFSASSDAPGVGEAMTRPAILAAAFAMFGYSYILYFFLSWFPTYLATAQHLPIQTMSLVSATPWALGFVGLASGGLISDAVLRRTGRALYSRKLVIVGSLIVAAICVGLAGAATSAGAAVALMSVSVFAMYMSGSLYFALVIDLTEAEHVGSVMGFVHFVANCAGILAPLVTGFIVETSGGFTAAFVLAGATALLGAAAVALAVRAPPAPRVVHA